jgi:hypothetical protein
VLLVSANVTMEDQLSFDRSNKRSSLLFNDSTISEAIYWRMNSDWMCNKWNVPNRVSCTPKTMRSPYEDTWTLVRFQMDYNLRDDPTDDVWTKVDHCLLRDDLRNMDDKCMLRISKVLLVIVTALNMVKCICIALTIRLHNQISIDTLYSGHSNNKTQEFITRVMAVIHKPKRSSEDGKLLYLVTLGDAMASFLRNGDKETQACGLASKQDFVKMKKRWPLRVRSSSRGPVRWFRAASMTRWGVTISLCVQPSRCDISI